MELDKAKIKQRISCPIYLRRIILRSDERLAVGATHTSNPLAPSNRPNERHRGLRVKHNTICSFLNGTHRTPGDENATLAWSTGWDLSDVDRFMFASVDLQFWLIVKKVDIVGEDGNLYYNNGEVAIVASSSNPEPHTARWYRRNGSKEDPWVSLGDHPRGCLYGGNKYGAHQDKLQAGGGMNVYIQKMT